MSPVGGAAKKRKLGKGGGGHPEPPTGSGPGGRITPGDIKAKVAELAGDVEEQVEAKAPMVKYTAIAGAAAVLLVAFWLGRRNGRRRSTVVEIRRV